jgi:PST family polysaccharide transporter
VISSFSLVQKSLLEKQLKISRLSKIEIISILCSSVTGVVAALLGAKIWSLVIQSLANTIIFTLLLWAFKIWTPRLIFEWKKVESIGFYSLNLVGYKIFDYVAMNADNILIGKFLGATDLGYYSLAYRIMLYPLQNLAWVINRVTFPVFSKMQDDNGRFRHAYLRIVSSIALITFPLMLGLWGLAKPFVLAVFGVQWISITNLLLILSPVGMFLSIGATVGIIYQAKGRTDWLFKWGLFAGVLRFTRILLSSTVSRSARTFLYFVRSVILTKIISN